MSEREIQEAAAQYRDTYDTALSELLSRVWGGNLHLGLFEDPAESLLAAQMRAKHYMARAASLQNGQEVVEAACGVGSTARYLALNYGVTVRARTSPKLSLLKRANSRKRQIFLSSSTSALPIITRFRFQSPAAMSGGVKRRCSIR